MTTGTAGFVEVREPGSQKLLLRFDPGRDIIEVQRRGIRTVVDLLALRAECGFIRVHSGCEPDEESGVADPPAI